MPHVENNHARGWMTKPIDFAIFIIFELIYHQETTSKQPRLSSTVFNDDWHDEQKSSKLAKMASLYRQC